MWNKDGLIESLNNRLDDILNQIREHPGRGQIKTQIKSLLQNTLARCDFVSRDAFEELETKLNETRQRVQALEAKLSRLEARTEEKELA